MLRLSRTAQKPRTPRVSPRHPAAKSSPLVLLSVVDISAYPDMKDAEDVTVPLMDQLKQRGARITREAAPFSLAATSFSRLDSTIDVDGDTMYQVILVTIRKRHIIHFTLTGSSEEEIRQSLGALKSLHFDSK